MPLNKPPSAIPDNLEPCCNAPVRAEWIEKRWYINGTAHNLIQQVEYYCSACDQRLYLLESDALKGGTNDAA